jgi:predicted peptidase
MLVLAGLLAHSARAKVRDGNNAFVDREIKIGEVTHRYKVFVPAGWNKKKKWPVILFLHGAGERGDDNLAQARVGIGPALEKHKSSLASVVVLPQCPKNRWWSEPDMQALALSTLQQALTEFRGDKSRIYLTGLSMGGYGTWSIVQSQPRKFAALAVVCGGIRPPRGVRIPSETNPDPAFDPYKAAAKKVGKTPVWIFHGAADPVVPVSESQKMVEALKAAKGKVRYSEYDAVGHNSWDKAYGEPEFFGWLLSHRK